MTDILPRKFYRLSGLHNVFSLSNNIYNTSNLVLSSEYKTTIDEHTILFLTADSTDAEKKVTTNNFDGKEDVLLYNNMTMIWARGNLYAIEQKTVKNVTYDKDSLAFFIEYSDGTEKRIVTSAMGFTAGDNIDIDNNNIISAIGYFFDEKNNFVINPDENSANGQTNAFITGVYPNVGDKTALMIVGAGTSNGSRSNAFSVNKSGIVTAKSDVILSDNECKLSEMHAVTDSDWAFIG